MFARLWLGLTIMMTLNGMNATGLSFDRGAGETELKKGWTLISSEFVSDREALHELNWKSSEVVNTQIPATVFGALVDAGAVEDPFWDKRLADFETAPYDQSWIYRTEFDLNAELPSEWVELVFEGINYRASVWLNGEKIADASTFEGPYKMARFDVTAHANPTGNVLVVEIFPPVKDDLTIGWVDWNPYPPDDNMGIWRPVKIKQSGAVSLRSPFVITKLDLEQFATAELELQGVLENHTAESQQGILTVFFEGDKVEFPFQLEAFESRQMSLSPVEFESLQVDNPKVWWPHDLGAQPLYHMDMSVSVGGNFSEQQRVRFGIREVCDYINAEGHRGWKVNGKEVLIRGGGWVDDLFLREDPVKLEAQLDYVKHMNLNTVRLEGFWGSTQRMFDLCDEKGILLMIGWSCHWEWEGYCNRPADNYLLIRPDEEEFQVQSFADQVKWVRNNPSVIMWVFGSDMIPRPSLEKRLWEVLDQVDPTRPRLLGCRNQAFGEELYFGSEAYGPVAVKMIGPYHYVTPNYWYEDKKLGGAFGFNTETGPGLQPAVLESVKRFTPENKLWPLNDVWDFHTGRGETFGDFKHWIGPFEARYGASDSVEDFSAWAQVSNYEAIRPMFEAFAANKPVATGVIQWMLNSSFPNHLWQLYDYYLMPTGAFYGTKKACQPLNPIYDYYTGEVVLSNDTLQNEEGLEVELRLYGLDSELIWSKKVDSLDLAAQSVMDVVKVPKLGVDDDSVTFLDLRLRDAQGKEIANNFYWVSSRHETLNYEDSTWYHTPNNQYADYSVLRNLPQAEVESRFVERGVENGKRIAEVELYNPSDHIAFFIELQLKDSISGDSILPVFWEDNYVSLLAGERRTIRVEFPDSDKKQGVDFTLEFLNAENL